MRAALIGLALLLALPVLGVMGAWLGLDGGSLDVLRQLADTVLPAYAGQSLMLVMAVAFGVAVVGGATAAAVTLFDFPGRRVFEWALLLPLAMPAYVLAYAYTDALQYSGPLQVALRAATGARGALWPDVRSLGGAMLLFVACLYPYVYLLARTALAEQAAPMMEAARLLGAPLRRRVLEVALPMARPALAAGVALALMETLADYGVGSYFGLTTFTTGIYKAWLVLDDHIAAAQLASMLLAVVALLMWAEQRAQARLRFTASRPSAGSGSLSARPIALHGSGRLAAWAVCGVPVLLGFVLPVAWLTRLLWQEAGGGDDGGASPVLSVGYLARFADWAAATFRLATIAAAAAVLFALLLAFALRRAQGRRARWLRGAAHVVSLGYAVPGAVVAVGILLWTGALQVWQPQWGAAALVTGTVFGLLYAYLVRFSAVALQSVQAGYARVPVSIDESARLLGAGRRRTFVELHLPLLGRTALAAALLVFVDTMKELPATLVLRPFGSDTLAVVAYQFARDERLAEAALPSLAIVVVGLIPVLLLSRALRSR
ncbi:iron ABC transporter permease [Ideonella sp.]|uniref:ABC transporter permease n=1 Tax=Ideonella sp. TaxID=1929293 RepID=UPI002B46F152|nr:iron ABC transporter permease [Ideonella sp.]HJV69043.1 iron ABC transporter permease [Ideonella sp.]